VSAGAGKSRWRWDEFGVKKTGAEMKLGCGVFGESFGGDCWGGMSLGWGMLMKE
jgi:hypothetical protein